MGRRAGRLQNGQIDGLKTCCAPFCRQGKTFRTLPLLKGCHYFASFLLQNIKYPMLKLPKKVLSHPPTTSAVQYESECMIFLFIIFHIS